MRTTLLALGIVAAGLLTAWALVGRRVELPPVAPGVELICSDTMQRTAADLSWVAANREETVRGREITTVTLGELRFHNGRLVRVAGVLHAEFESVGLYPSRAAMEEGWRAPSVRLGSLWPDEPYWRTKGPSISDRCVVVEGTYSRGAVGDSETFNGTIGDVLRLEVWSNPHRPFANTPPLPPPLPPARGDSACSEKPSTPEKLPDASADQEMLAEFNKLYETKEFQLGYCLVDVKVNQEGAVDSVRVLRPQNMDKRVESVIVQTVTSWRYKPATACGRSVTFSTSVGIGHCPTKGEGLDKPDR